MTLAKINKFGMTLLALLLTACQQHSEKARPEPATPQEIKAWAEKNCSASQDEHCSYFAAMQYAVMRNFYDADRYKGRECAVAITYRNGRYSVQSTTGDEQLCLKAWSTIGSAKNLPPPPASLPASMVIDFRPY